PTDQTIDYRSDGTLAGSFMTTDVNGVNNIYTGVTADPTDATKWQWNLNGMGVALTSTPGSAVGATRDQPWLLTLPGGANDFVAYDDFPAAGPPIPMRVASSDGAK